MAIEPKKNLDKKTLRAECLSARERITPEEARAASLGIAKHLIRLVPGTGLVVAGYRPVRGEIDVFEAMAQLSERGHTLCLPVMMAPRAPLIFRRWKISHPLEVGQYGIEVPPETEPELVPDVVLAPLVAFDKDGHRLGYGAGFYDITIRELRKVKPTAHIIGVAFASQEVAHIPAEPHDAKLDAVVTEKGGQ